MEGLEAALEMLDADVVKLQSISQDGCKVGVTASAPGRLPTLAPQLPGSTGKAIPGREESSDVPGEWVERRKRTITAGQRGGGHIKGAALKEQGSSGSATPGEGSAKEAGPQQRSWCPFSVC